MHLGSRIVVVKNDDDDLTLLHGLRIADVHLKRLVRCFMAECHGSERRVGHGAPQRLRVALLVERALLRAVGVYRE